MSTAVLRSAARAVLPPPGTPILVGVSGGCDSMVLLHWLHRQGVWPLQAVHVDHGLRAEAGDDAALVAAVCAELDIPCHQHRRDVAAAAERWGMGWEEAGRRIRYRCFTETMSACGIGHLCCAHHRDDQAETVLANILRGAGPVGHAGMPASRPLGRGLLLRPLLTWSRGAIRRLAQTWGLRWCEDASNSDTRFQRNRLRHVVLPSWEAGCPGFTDALLAWSQRQTADLAAQERRLAGRLTMLTGERLPVAAWDGLDRADRLLLWRHWLGQLGLPLSRRILRRVDDCACGAMGRRFHLGDRLLLRCADGLRSERLALESPTDRHWPLDEAALIDGHRYRAVLAAGPCQVPADRRRAVIDAAAVVGTMVWRRAQPGERWRACGAPGSKSVFRWLGERGVAAPARAQCLVLADDCGVLWVPDHAIAHRARVSAATNAAWLLARDPALPAVEAPQTCPA